MSFLEILLIGIGLSMDACAVSATDGMCYKQLRIKHYFIIALFFGTFQGIMPLIGYFAGSAFSNSISAFNHWIALILLSFIGGKMLLDGIKKDDDKLDKAFTLKLLLLQAIATSIDALAVGVSFAAMNTNICKSVLIIAATTFVLSFITVIVGKNIGDKLNSKAEVFGGIILIATGLKIFIEHMLRHPS